VVYYLSFFDDLLFDLKEKTLDVKKPVKKTVIIITTSGS